MRTRVVATSWLQWCAILATCICLISSSVASEVEENESSDVLSRLSFSPYSAAFPRQRPSANEPLYLTSRIGRATVLRTAFDAAGGVGMQADIGHGFARRESAAGAEGLSAEPCYGPGI